MIPRTVVIVTGAVILAVLSAAVVLSQATVKRMTFRPIASVRGVDVYKAYCATCHGDDGKGQGPSAAGLKVKVPDLTTIAIRNGGNFSFGAVEDSINRWKQVPQTMTDVLDIQQGRQALPMPAFGPIFAQLYPQEVNERRMRMSNLISYIKSLQVAQDPAQKK